MIVALLVPNDVTRFWCPIGCFSTHVTTIGWFRCKFGLPTIIGLDASLVSLAHVLLGAPDSFWVLQELQTAGLQTVGPRGRNLPNDIYPPIVDRIYPITRGEVPPPFAIQQASWGVERRRTAWLVLDKLNESESCKVISLKSSVLYYFIVSA